MRSLPAFFARLGLAAVSFTALGLAASPTFAQTPSDLLTRVPDAPGAAALDISRTENSPPSVMRRLSLEVLNNDEAMGFAAETSPYLIYLGLRYAEDDTRHYMSAQDYKNNELTRALANISLSAAAVRSSAEKGDRAAIALRWTVFNLGDPYSSSELYDANSHTGCVATAIKETPPPPAPDVVSDTPPATRVIEDPALAEKITKCVEDFEKKHWNATSLQLSAVQLWNAPGEGLSELDPAGQRYTAVLSYGFEGWGGLRDKSQLLVNVGYGENVRFVDEGGNASRRDETRAGLRLRIAPTEASGRDFNISAEANFSNNNYTTVADDQKEWTYRIGAEWRVGDNAWLSVTGEDRSGDDVAGDEKRVGLQLRWALGDKAIFGG